ncbi:MAG: insulinase family protein [Candidatus Solibacter usitatus]|nr:insulinase family protein [Candidatus Solibacter usitatus]
MNVIARPDPSPLVTFRLVWRTGAAQDPPGQGGAAWMTAMMLASGGSRGLSYKQILDLFFPMGVSVACQTDKEMIAFSAEVHRDHFLRFYDVFRGMLLDPGWREDDFERLIDDAVNFLEVGLRGQNDEELAKEVLYQEIFSGHPYQRHSAGSVESLRGLRVEDLRRFYFDQFTGENLTIGLAGGFPPGFDELLRSDFALLPSRNPPSQPSPAVRNLDENELILVEKPARGVAISLGFPIGVRRGHPDFPALLLAASALGQHRMSSGRLFTRMRQLRGLNYGDYAYVEYFPGGMFTLEPGQNLVRENEIFQLWIRPVERQQAHFALRLALHELENLVCGGLTPEEFDRTRSFLSKYVNLLLKTKVDELGYAIDSAYYGIPSYPEYVRVGMSALTLESVNAAIRRHLRSDRLAIVMVGREMAELRDAILTDAVSPMTYNSPKPDEILEEDKLVERRRIPLRAERAKVLPVDEVFAREA